MTLAGEQSDASCRRRRPGPRAVWDFLSPLRAQRPLTAVRLFLMAEVLVFLGVLAAFMNLSLPADGEVRFVHVAVYVFAGAYPILMNLLHGDRPADSGIRIDNLLSSAGELAAASVVMATGVLVTGVAVDGFDWAGPMAVAAHLGRYLGWGFVQQYWMHAFAVRRFRQAGVGKAPMVPLAGVLFGLMHAPNWPLVALTGGAAMVWCALFLRKPNLFTLAASHAVLAVLVRYSLPESWMHRLTVGGIYLRAVSESM